MNDLPKPKVGIYSPYLSMMGGGERYLLTIADELSRHHCVTVFGSEEIRARADALFHLSLPKVHFLTDHPLTEQQIWNKYLRLWQYDLFFHVTDGSLFFPMGKKNFLIVQSPDHIPKTIFNKIKGLRWKIICYSEFMQGIIKEQTGRLASILPPAIDTGIFSNKKNEKEKYILTVGRFFPYPHNKKHDVLIKAFTQAYKTHFQGWKLIVAGGLTEQGGDDIVQKLKELAKGFPVEILVDLPFSDLLKLYQQATIYWHGAGYGEDLDAHPERAEHFGITPLEAMACGAVPIVYEGGGQKDIIEDGKSGYFWKTSEELVRKTARLIEEKDTYQTMQHDGQVRVQYFSLPRFTERLMNLINSC